MEIPKGESSVEDWCCNLRGGYLEDALVQFSVRLSPPNSSFQSCDFAATKSMEEVISIPMPAETISSHNSPDEYEYEYQRRRTRMRRRRRVRVAYPFALVKPGGIDGDLTLDDINKRTMMAPSRAVRHPVGDYACRPCVTSPHGPGLSGKPVVALTRIHTQGRGTITIVRTKD